MPELEGIIVDELAADDAIRGLWKIKIQAPKNKPPLNKEEMKVHHWLGINPLKGDFGIEVEVEGRRLPPFKSNKDSQWVYKKDGSLREGVEYVLVAPLPLDKAKESLSYLKERLADSEVRFSFRTSIHVHVNVLDLSRSQLCSYLYLAHLLEDALVKYSGEHREGNRFCLRMKDAEWKIIALKEFFKNKGLKMFSPLDMKYSAINLASLHMFGSIEFRSMRGTLDKGILFPWLDALYRIRDFAMHNSVKEIDEAIRLTPSGVAKEVFGEHFDKFNYLELEKDIKEAHCRLIELPYIKGI